MIKKVRQKFLPQKSDFFEWGNRHFLEMSQEIVFKRSNPDSRPPQTSNQIDATVMFSFNNSLLPKSLQNTTAFDIKKHPLTIGVTIHGLL